MKQKNWIFIFPVLFLFTVKAQYPVAESSLDRKVQRFLEEHVDQWRDMNVPVSDGRILYDVVLSNGYTQAVEIGTSTGHSAIWIAWALSKTGGKLITIEIDKERWLKARANFKKAGVDKFIDARLADAHQLVPMLPGRYDFVFCDADKHWYLNYFKDMNPKLEERGCFAAHNTSFRMAGVRAFLDYIESLDNYNTTYAPGSRSGLSLSYKTAAGVSPRK